MGTCPSCGAPLDADSACPRCVLVDVLVVTPPRDAKARLAAAQAIGALGPPAPTFLEAKARLAAPGPLARGIPPGAGAQLQQIAREHGGLLSVQAHTAAPPHPTRLGSWLWVAGALTVAGLTTWAGLRPQSPPPPAAAREPEPAPAPPAASGPALPAPNLAEPGDLAERARQASVEVRCPGPTGYGFLFADRRALVPRQALCAADQPLQLQFADGRRGPAVVERLHPRLGLVTLRVEAEAPAALPCGDSTALGVDAALEYLPEPILAQLAATRVARAEIADCGVPLLSLAGAGPRPGVPLLHRGRVVGIAVELPEALVPGPLAAPIETVLPPLGTHAAGWNRRRQATQEPDARLRAGFLKGLDQPYLAGVARAPGGIRAALLVPQPAPEGNAVRLRWRVDGISRCQVSAAFGTLVPLGEASPQLRAVPRVEWLLEEPGATALLAGEAVLASLDCAPEDLEAAGVLELPAGEGHSGRAAVGAGELAAAIRSTLQKEAAALARQEEAREQQAQMEKELLWRQRFGELRHRLEQAERRVETTRKDLARRQGWSGSMDEAPTSLGDLERLKAVLAEAEAELERLRAEEHELERLASLASVPREWRR